ncbi:transcription factor bHLH68-like isoform X1 [Cucurbita moschata]|uniref:Transcription factor bHLH68-like isoform X1 n=1 Tax=Cucurbita moschata TaxID=3662 RepID=A0A6J1GA41_CUCMO|nr:transcription factor bHLH68-like isoform X1 [Cucurbita moschata]XP_022948767.1 transcription factor bHLH68-like isoform X1 [Cucurbita moschata]
MMGGNPSNWWNMFPPNSLPPPPPPPPPQFVVGSSSLPFTSMADHPNQEHPNSQSWSQLLLGGLQEGDGDGLVLNSNYNHFQPKKLDNLEGRILIPFPRFGVGDDDGDDDHVLKQQTCSQSGKSLSFLWNEKESCSSSSISMKGSQTRPPPTTSSSPKSSVNSNAILEFSFNKLDSNNQFPDHTYSSECVSTAATGGVCKKPRVQPVSGQPPIKNQVRKEKVGDRITALHQLVSPFGKTDTASVLSEAIGYVRFLHNQIEALISPYLGNNSSEPTRTDQLLFNDSTLKRKLPPTQEKDEEANALRSRGLCLVPVSCTQHVQSDVNGADYWAQAYNGSF